MGRESGEAVSSWIFEADNRLTPLWSLDFVPERPLVFFAIEGVLFGVVSISSDLGKASVEDSTAEGRPDASASETADESKPSRLRESLPTLRRLMQGDSGECPLAKLGIGRMEPSMSDSDGDGDGRRGVVDVSVPLLPLLTLPVSLVVRSP